MLKYVDGEESDVKPFHNVVFPMWMQPTLSHLEKRTMFHYFTVRFS